jgi:alanyl-tRNA synthetase
VLAGAQNGRIPLVVGVTPDLKDRVHAGSLVQQVARQADGGGGGNNPEFARGQGTNPAKIGAALQHVYTLVEQALQQG